MDGYYYLHTNGDLIYKPAAAVETDDEYFESPYVKHVWTINLKDRGDCWKIVLEALSMGCQISRAKELAEKWKMDFNDSVEMIKRIKPTDAMKRGLKSFIEHVLEMTVEEWREKVLAVGKKEEEMR